MSELDSSDNKDDHVVGEIVIHATFLACADFNLGISLYKEAEYEIGSFI